MKRAAVLGITTVAVGAALARSRRRAAAGVAGVVGPRLQAWVPDPPQTPLTRLLGIIWASPITAAGLLAGAASAARPRLVQGVLLFAPARGVTGWMVRRRGFAAAGLGHVVIALDEPSTALLVHELAHVRQAERLGPLMAPTYLALLAVHGYQRHPMERAARLAADGIAA